MSRARSGLRSPRACCPRKRRLLLGSSGGSSTVVPQRPGYATHPSISTASLRSLLVLRGARGDRTVADPRAKVCVRSLAWSAEIGDDLSRTAPKRRDPSGHDRGSGVGREENRRRLQDLIRSAKLLHLAFKLTHPLSLIGRQPRPPTRVGLGSTNPDPQRLMMNTELLSNRPDCLPLRRILMLMLEH